MKTMVRREFLKSVSMGAAAAVVPSLGVAESAATDGTASGKGKIDKPNIVFFVSDQHRAGLTKRSGYPLDTSPTLDRLAESGIGFDRAYCTAPLCVPSRTSMLTGRWPEAHRVRMNLDPEDAFYSKHLYQVAKEQGYRTGLAGKNHTFLKEGDLDFWRQYDLARGYMPPNAPADYKEFERWMRSLRANVALEPTPFPLEVQYPYRIVSDAMDFVNESGSEPFILQVGFSEPHDPEQVPKPYWDYFPPDQVPPRCAGPEAIPHLGYRMQWENQHAEQGFPTEKYWRRYVSNYLSMLKLLDDQLERFMSFMQSKDLLKNTVFIYLADHGDYVMQYGMPRKGVGMPECLARIPMVWSGYGVTPSNVGSSAFVSMADVMPTLCEVMGAEIPEGVQGRSLWPLLQGKDYPREEFRSIVTGVGVGGLYYDAADKVPYTVGDAPPQPNLPHIEPGHGWDELNKVSLSGAAKMVRMGDWKLIFDMMGYGQLYHLKSDPCELNNLFGQPSVAAEQANLMAELCMWTIRNQDSLPTGPQNGKYQTKWSKVHNWYAPYRHGIAPEAFIP